MSYVILRFHLDGPTEVIETGVSLAEAQEHCNDPATHGEDWFDGYVEEEEDDDR